MNNLHKFFNTYLNYTEAKKCYYTFDKIAFVSEIAKTSFMEETGWNLNAEVVHNTLDIDKIKLKSKEQIPFNLNSKYINLCSVGRLTQQKGYLRLVHLLGELYREGISNWHLYLLGQGEQKKELEKAIFDNGLNSQIELLGYDSNPYKYVSKMDLFICSSFREGYSTAVTESIIVGTPVITTNCAGMQEIIGDTAGVIVNNDENSLKDGLRRLLENPQLIKTYKKNALVRSRIFSKEHTLNEFETFINN